jgi:Resolvase, N terminal domain
MAPMPVSQAPRQPRNVLYIIRATQSDRDAEVAEIRAAPRIAIDPDRDILFVAPPSELRDKPATRPAFQRVMAELQPYDLLVVTRLNRLGRTTAEVLDTVKQLESRKVRLRCLELGDHRAELTEIDGRSSEHGPLILRTMEACAKLEREERARRQATKYKTKRQGRPPALKTENKRREAVERCQVPGGHRQKTAFFSVTLPQPTPSFRIGSGF